MPPTPDQQNPPAASPDPQQQAAAAATGPTPTQVTPVDQGATPTTTPTTPMVPAPATPSSAQPQAPGWTQDHGAKHVLGEIFQTLAGGKKIVYTQGPNGPVKTYQDLKPGEMARGILAAAITGLASGYDPANRGKGPAMSSAFASGFKGEDQERKGLEAQKEQEAQQEFVNNNLSEEMKMKKAKFAQDQAQSILDYQRTQQEIKQAAVRANQEGIVFDQTQDAYLDAQDNKYAKIAAIGKPIDDPKHPGQPFIFYDDGTAHQYLTDHADHLIKPGEFNSQVVRLPGGKGFEIMEINQRDLDGTQVRFAKMDPKNPTQPLKDKDGKWIPDGVSRDQSGKQIVPGYYTGAEYSNLVSEADKHREAVATAEEKFAAAEKDRMEIKNNKAFQAASDRIADAGNNPYAVNTATGQWIMTDPDRHQQQQFWASQVHQIESGLTKANTQIQSMDPESQEAKTLRETINKQNQEHDAAKAQLALYADRNITKGKGMADSLLRENDDDPQKAGKVFEENVKANKYGINLKPSDIADVRKALSGAAIEKQRQDTLKQNAAKNPVNNLQQGIIDRLKGQPVDVVTQQLDLNKVDPAMREGIYKGLGLTPPPPPKRAPAGAQTVKDVAGSAAYFAHHPNEAPPIVIP